MCLRKNAIFFMVCFALLPMLANSIPLAHGRAPTAPIRTKKPINVSGGASVVYPGLPVFVLRYTRNLSPHGAMSLQWRTIFLINGLSLGWNAYLSKGNTSAYILGRVEGVAISTGDKTEALILGEYGVGVEVTSDGGFTLALEITGLTELDQFGFIPGAYVMFGKRH